MKKLLLLIFVLEISLSSKAQYIDPGLDEPALIGKWVAADVPAGCINYWDFCLGEITEVEFCDNEYTKIRSINDSKKSNEYWAKGFWITGEPSGVRTIHFLNRDALKYNAGVLNFVVYGYDENTLLLKSYDRTRGVVLVRSSVSGVSDVSNDKRPTGKIYDLNGNEIEEPESGFYIQDGKKKFK